MALLDEKMEDNSVETEAVAEEEVVDSQEVIEEEIVVEENGKQTTSKKSKDKKPSFIKAAFSELKKVSWPTFGSVIKKTVVVLSVTAIFLVVVFGIDSLLKLLYDLLTKNI